MNLKEAVHHMRRDGIYMYDPRDNTMKSSNNPALWLAHFIITGSILAEMADDFWLDIAHLADWCDEKIEVDP